MLNHHVLRLVPLYQRSNNLNKIQMSHLYLYSYMLMCVRAFIIRKHCIQKMYLWFVHAAVYVFECFSSLIRSYFLLLIGRGQWIYKWGWLTCLFDSDSVVRNRFLFKFFNSLWMWMRCMEYSDTRHTHSHTTLLYMAYEQLLLDCTFWCGNVHCSPSQSRLFWCGFMCDYVC